MPNWNATLGTRNPAAAPIHTRQTEVGCMALPVLRPGQTHQAVVKLKGSLVEVLKAGNHDRVAGSVRLDSKTYGRTTVRAVKTFQRTKQLGPDGVVGEHTWRGLGFHD